MTVSNVRGLRVYKFPHLLTCSLTLLFSVIFVNRKRIASRRMAIWLWRERRLFNWEDRCAPAKEIVASSSIVNAVIRYVPGAVKVSPYRSYGEKNNAQNLVERRRAFTWNCFGRRRHADTETKIQVVKTAAALPPCRPLRLPQRSPRWSPSVVVACERAHTFSLWPI